MNPRRLCVFLGLLSAALLAMGTAPGALAKTHQTVSGAVKAPDDQIGQIAAEYGQMRTAPGTFVPGDALLAARSQADSLVTVGGSWQQQTNQPYNEQPAGYNDPFWSNASPAPGAGFGNMSGRATALASTADGAVYVGTADGGVWKLPSGSSTWQPLSDQALPSNSIGALAVNPADGTLWIGTGEANTNSDSYNGVGVYRLVGGAFIKVGTTELTSRTVYQLAFDGVGGVYAATNWGLYKTTADGAGAWARLVHPGPDGIYNNHATTVVIGPGKPGKHVITVNGYRGNGGPTPYNGFFESSDFGATFHQVNPIGINQADIGRTSMAYASDGRLYAVIESPQTVALLGVYVSKTGDAAGPWKQIANEATLEASGSALSNAIGFPVGVQAWYNNVLSVNPDNPDQLYVGLEEVFQTNDGGKSWKTASPYWNFGLACFGSSTNPCPPTTHPDQHAQMIAGGRLWIGNDGGVFNRPLSVTGYGSWTELNDTLHTLQFYDAKAATDATGNTYWGGMQDNADGLLKPGAAQMVGPASGDGFDVIIDPANPDRLVGEYTNLITYSSTDGGHHFHNMSPACAGQGGFAYPPNVPSRADCDPSTRFWAPYTSDSQNVNNWIAGGRYVWNTSKGWDTSCPPDPNPCDWKPVYDLGAGRAATAVAQTGSVEYAAWVHGGNPSASFSRGIATNYGGTWHPLDVSSLPNRFIAGLTIASADGSDVFAVMNGYSRRWIPGGGTGVVFESKDGGAHWTNVSLTLPDAPGNELVKVGNQLVLATDVGVFSSSDGGAHWARLGSGLPNVSVNSIHVAPDGTTLVAGTHGRGIWTLSLGS